MVARRDFVKWAAAVPVGFLVGRGLSACDDGVVAGSRAGLDGLDTGDGLATDLGGGEVLIDTGAVLDVAPEAPDAAADVNAQDAQDIAPDGVAETADSSPPDAGPQVCGPTKADAQGPYYVTNAPTIVDLAVGFAGARLSMSGVVMGPDCRPIRGAKVEVWQADSDGDYHDGSLRASLVADESGRYAFASIVPGAYLQANGFRPAHLHYKVSAAGFRTIVTQIYFAGDPYLQPNDSCAGCGSDDPDRIIAMTDGVSGKVGICDVTLRGL